MTRPWGLDNMIRIDEKTNLIRTSHHDYLKDYNKIKEIFSLWWEGKEIHDGIKFAYYQLKTFINLEKEVYFIQVIGENLPHHGDPRILAIRAKRKMDKSINAMNKYFP